MGTGHPSVGGLPILPLSAQKHHVPILAGSFGWPACPVLPSSFQAVLESLPCSRKCGPEQGVFISYALPPSFPRRILMELCLSIWWNKTQAARAALGFSSFRPSSGRFSQAGDLGCLPSGLMCSLTEVDNQLGSCYSTLICKKNNLALKGGFVCNSFVKIRTGMVGSGIYKRHVAAVLSCATPQAQ